MIWFLILAALAALLAAGFIARPLLGAARAAPPRAAHDAQVFRDQLAELDRDIARGTVSAAEAEGARLEIARRLLAADAEADAGAAQPPAPRAASRGLAAMLVIGAPLAAGMLYWSLGAPTLPDHPMALVRPDQATAEASIEPAPIPEADPAVLAEIERLTPQAEAGERRALYFLAEAQMAAGRYREAWRNYDALVQASEGEAPAPIFSALGEAMVLAAQGYVSPEAESAFRAALEQSPKDPIARYYAGVTAQQAGDARSAMAIWRDLLNETPQGAPWIEPTLARMRDLAQTSSLPMPQIAVPSPSPSPGPGPTPEQMRDAANLSEQERAEMIAGMVERLRSRLEDQGGQPDEWARLMQALVVQGDRDGALAALERARAAYAEDAAALAELARAAQALGLAGAPEPAPPGPSAEQMRDAAQMSEADRAAMIAAMVARLQDRLDAEGGAAEEWARLMRALTVQGDLEGARDALTRARAAHKGDDSAQQALAAAAAALGISE